VNVSLDLGSIGMFVVRTARMHLVWQAIVVLFVVPVPSADASGSHTRTVRAHYEGYIEIEAGPAHVGVGDVCPEAKNPGCVGVKVRPDERVAVVRVRDASGESIPFVTYDDVNGDGSISSTESKSACGSIRTPVGGGSMLMIAVQAGFASAVYQGLGDPTDTCASVPSSGTVVATLSG